MAEWSVIILNKLTWRFSLLINEFIEIHLFYIFLGFYGKYQVLLSEIKWETVFVSSIEMQFGPQTISEFCNPGGCFLLSIPNDVDRTERRAEYAIMDVNSQICSNYRFLFLILIFQPSTHINSSFLSAKYPSNPWKCIIFIQENNIPPLHNGVKEFSKEFVNDLRIF